MSNHSTAAIRVSEHEAGLVPEPDVQSVTNDSARSSRGLASALRAIREVVTVATLLRTIGAAAMVGSISVFLLAGFDTQSDLTRVFMLLGQTGLLAVTGLLVGFALREAKGARVFLTLALVSVPANFAVLAAMIYSVAPLDGGLAVEQYPEFARWQASSLQDLTIALVSGLALLLPTTVFAFKVLARRLAVPLSFALLTGSAVLLLPVRDPAMVSIAVMLLVLGTITMLLRNYRRFDVSARLMTFEEKLANLLLLIAPGIMMGRSLIVHGVNDVSALALAATAYCLLYRLMRLVQHSNKQQMFVAVLTIVAGLSTAVLVFSTFWGYLPAFLIMPGFVAILAALLYPLAARSESSAIKRLAAGCWTLFSSIAVAAGAFFAYGLIEVVSIVAVAGAIVGFGVVTASTRRMAIGLVGMVAVVFQHIDDVVPLFVDAGWVGLAGLGAVAIVSGSLLERFGPALKLRFARHSVAFDQRQSHDSDVEAALPVDARDSIPSNDCSAAREKLVA